MDLHLCYLLFSAIKDRDQLLQAEKDLAGPENAVVNINEAPQLRLSLSVAVLIKQFMQSLC